ncbi:DEAD/DEAH box helicase [Paenibacillus hamazuiensis]|uniref:DEAD/DEAH box helicase n=1 Tax=Paenibacillus hamazuiensis TaxID=2936508 RepID=UPI00200FA1C3|nr:DEAD/DEAH box helicase [Paenibacillus hamazuiensis]
MKQKFLSLGIRTAFAQTLQAEGITEPTPVQEQAIPVIMGNHDVIVQAQTGTGKTLAFLLPILERIDVARPDVQALILTPTRELAIQITDELKKLAPVAGAGVLAAYGGQDVERQIRKLAGAIHIVVGTPGRVLDHLKRGSVHFGKLSALVLDEADQMLHMGFMAEVEQIIGTTSGRRQTMLFSATMPAGVRNLAKRYMKQPREILIPGTRVTLEEIEQMVVRTPEAAKTEALCGLIERHNPFLALVFCRTRAEAAALTGTLIRRGFEADELHGDLTQAKREQVMKRFRDAKIQLLVATDIAARGLDVEGITHVYSYDIPHDAETYIHRIGRTGRAGETGVAVTLMSDREQRYLDLIEKGIKMKLNKVRWNGEDAPAEPDRERGRQPGGGVRTGARDAAGARGRNGHGRRGAARFDGAGRGAGAAARDARAGRGGGAAARDARAGRGNGAAARDARAGRGNGAAARDARAGRDNGAAARDARAGRGNGAGRGGAAKPERGRGRRR